MVDAGKLRTLLARIGDRRERLARYAGQPLTDYLADQTGILASKYLLVTVIEDALRHAFRVLAERDVVEAALGRRLEAMARFRNLLIHVYAEIDDARVHRSLTADLADLDAYVAAVLAAFPDLGREETA